MVRYRIKKGRGRKSRFISGYYLSKKTAKEEAKKIRASIRHYGSARTSQRAANQRAKSVRIIKIKR